MPGFAQQIANGWVFSDIEEGDEYEVEVKADGYQTAHESVILAPGSGNANIIVFLKPADEKLNFRPPAGQFVLAPRAQKEVEKGMKDLRDDKIPSAQKHFQKALTMAPGNPYVNYVMGMSFLLAKELADARPYLEKSVSIDPKQADALLALGTLYFQLAEYPTAIQILNQETQLDSSPWKAEWMLAECYLHQTDFAESRAHAEKAILVGKQKATPAELILGQALASLGDRGGAVKALQIYLAAYPKDPRVSRIQAYIEKLQHPAVVEATVSAVPTRGPSAAVSSVQYGSVGIPAPAPPVELPPKENWAPVDIDAEKPFVIPGASCPLAKVLDEAGKNTLRFVSDLEKFTATEGYESVEVKRNENLETPVSRTFNYLVFIQRPAPNLIEVNEIRNNNLGAADMPGGRVADNGAPGLVLAFHPLFRQDFTWQCEGLGQWKDQPVWLVRFQQKTDRPISKLAAYETPSGEFDLPLKGRAWISSRNSQVVRLEADLLRPVEPLGLKRQHYVIQYAPFSFATHKVTLWLPESVDVYIQFQGHYLHHQHRFSNLKLFWVGSSQKIGQPKETSKTRPPS